ncbi:primosomal protein N' [Bifidobacterium indicum]|uniref:primosomal protein N' family DNA-binding protein n=1 Tax=Bifidobacterium indicum TaxID=1691 RepID=UPI0030DC7BEA
MNPEEAQQLALDGLAPRKPRRTRATKQHVPADRDPVAQVVLNVQATHLGGTFDYLVDRDQDQGAQPGSLVRVRFGRQLINGVIWGRQGTSQVPASSLRYLERVIIPHALVSASLREDITGIARAYGGTEANILRLAVPPRVARIDKEQQLVPGQPRLASDMDGVARLDRVTAGVREDLNRDYDRLGEFAQALQSQTFASFLADIGPGPGRAELLAAWSLVEALLAGRSAVMVLPDMRAVEHLSSTLQALGLAPFGPRTGGIGDPGGPGWAGDYAILDSSMAPAERYRSYLALASGQVRCVIGLRAAMYAPVEGPALFALMDDAAYQSADGMMPYANARGVLRLRAKTHGGVFLVLARSRSVRSQWESGPLAKEVDSGVTGPIRPLHSSDTPGRARLPWVRWLNREELTRLADPTIGARVPHTAVSALRKALDAGPVLLSIPQDGFSQALSCARCHRQARCPRCTGPLQSTREAVPRCAWCGVAATNWTCPVCGGERLRVVRVGAAGTAQELRMLFRNVPILISSPSQPRGPVSEVDQKSRLVIATPGAEPIVVPRRGADDQGAVDGVHSDSLDHRPGYAAIAILDAWTSLYAQGVDARIDTLSDWMRTASLCRPRDQGGQVFLLGETDPQLAQALITWRSPLLAGAELDDRRVTGMPPAYSLATIWGGRRAVTWILDRIGAATGDLALLKTEEGEVPATLGPVPIPPPRTLVARQLEGTQDRVRALVRVTTEQRDLLADLLRRGLSEYLAKRGREELKFQMDPKDLT